MIRPLACVAVVCRSRSDVGAADDVVRLIDAFVDPVPYWTLVTASAKKPAGLLRLMKRIAANDPDDLPPLLKQQIFTRTLANSARRGDLPVVQWLVEEYLLTGKIREPLMEAVGEGHLAVVQWLAENCAARLVWKHEEIERAAKYDHLQTARWLFERSGRFGGDEAATNLGTILVSAARIGDMGAIEWVYGQSRQCGVGITPITAEVSLNMAMLSGHRDAIRFIADNFGGSFNGGCLNATIKSGHLDIAQEVQAHTGSRRISAECLIKPASRGQIDMVEWVLRTFELTDQDRLEAVLTVAAEAGCLDIIKRIHKICPSKCRTNPIDVAAKRGHLEVIKWLHANRHDQGCSMAMNYAAFNGHLDVAQWLHENRSEGCSPSALTWAAQANHIDVVKWIVAVRPERWGTPQSNSDQAILDAISIAINAAAGHGHLEIVKWLHEQHGDGSSNSDAVAAAARNGHLVVAKWLYNNNFKCTTKAFDLAAGGGHLEIVKWLHSIGCACSVRAMDWAAGDGHLEIVKWLHTNCTEGCTGDAFRRAAWHKRASVFRWLFTNKPEQLTIDRTQMAAAVVGGDLEIVMLVCQQMSGGWEFLTSLMVQALQYKHYEVFEWLLLEHGNGFAHVDEWLRDEMQTSCDAYATDIMQALLIRSVSS